MEETDRALSQIYGLVKYQGRAMTSVHGERGRSVFLIGTCSLKEENEVHLISFDEEKSEIDCDEIMHHGAEIWSLEACPSNADLFFSVYNTVKEKKASLWKIIKGAGDPYRLDKLIDIDTPGGDINRVIWSENEEKKENIIVFCKSNFFLYDIEAGEEYGVGKIKSLSDELPKYPHHMYCAAVDPHRRHRLLTARSSTLVGWDLRTLEEIFTINHAHSANVRDVDFNANKPHYVVSCGDDRYVKLWDLRSHEEPVYTVEKAHSHWIWNAKFNPFNDQFVITSSSDTNVALWSFANWSSVNEGVRKLMGNKMVRKYDEHEESVYSVAWSATDPYVFASLSYGGRVVLSRIPEAERRICLEY